jgi:hypothetical protein
MSAFTSYIKLHQFILSKHDACKISDVQLDILYDVFCKVIAAAGEDINIADPRNAAVVRHATLSMKRALLQRFPAFEGELRQMGSHDFDR